MSLDLHERGTQRLALRVIFVVLGLLALTFGVRSGGSDDTPVAPAPASTAPTP